MAEFLILSAGASAAVADNLANADKAEGMPHAGTTAHGGTHEEHVAPITAARSLPPRVRRPI